MTLETPLDVIRHQTWSKSAEPPPGLFFVIFHVPVAVQGSTMVYWREQRPHMAYLCPLLETKQTQKNGGQ